MARWDRKTYIFNSGILESISIYVLGSNYFQEFQTFLKFNSALSPWVYARSVKQISWNCFIWKTADNCVEYSTGLGFAMEKILFYITLDFGQRGPWFEFRKRNEFF